MMNYAATLEKNIEKVKEQMRRGEKKDAILQRRVMEIERLRAGKQSPANVKRLEFVLLEYQAIIEIDEREVMR